MESEPARGGDRFEGGSACALGIVPSALRNGRCAAGAATGLENPGRSCRAAGLDTLTFRWPRPSRSTGPA
jgi:hypothetical protein